MKKKAILVGASGATGSSLLFQLLENKNYSDVLVLARRELRIQHTKLKQLIIDFDRVNDYAAEINGDVVFCCLGTTKSQTPDEQQYRKIDYQYPLDIARLAKNNGAKSYHLISFIGANKNSSFFYPRIKGELENDLRSVPFENIHIYRPFLLDAPRKDKRFTEVAVNVMMQIINPLLIGGLKKYRSIKAENIAKAMIRLSLEDRKGLFIHEPNEIQRLGDENNVPYR
jgi:uncharacterized protein YbjT (DUF2867 family)